MRCLFCKRDSEGSRSKEHVIPESLGNTTLVLPAGVVCDGCNNYLAREVEKPFLESPAIRTLRFHQAIPSKRRVIPSLEGRLTPGYPATVYRYAEGWLGGLVSLPAEGAQHLIKGRGGVLLLPGYEDLPRGPVTSRFLAKVALEAMAHRLVDHEEGLDYLVGEAQLDPLRNHARRGDTRTWPCHVRRIYDSETEWVGATRHQGQIVWECDLLVTERSEWYFVLALFGTEMTINVGGPETEGYTRWLAEHSHVSPLYWGTNANLPYRRRARPSGPPDAQGIGPGTT